MRFQFLNHDLDRHPPSTQFSVRDDGYSFSPILMLQEKAAARPTLAEVKPLK